MSKDRTNQSRRPFYVDTVDFAQVPHERKGKHTTLMRRILQNLEKLEYDVAIKVPISDLGSQKIENVRAALAREIRKTSLVVGTSFDGEYFYVWRKKS